MLFTCSSLPLRSLALFSPDFKGLFIFTIFPVLVLVLVIPVPPSL
jgi:hypothetical protein